MHFTIDHHAELPSTSTLALERAREGAAEGLVIVTDFQTAGRGKPGNTWQAARGKDLLFSVLLRPPIETNRAPMLTQIGCRAVSKVLESVCGLSCAFKRPNDILVGGKKICGILVESASSEADGKHPLTYAVIGIGLNVNSTGKDLIEGATSIKIESGRETSRDIILNHILNQLAMDLKL